MPVALPLTPARVALLCVGCAVAACSSGPRVQFHTLLAPASAEAAPAGAAPFSFRIESPVRVPAQVDQPQLVLRAPGGAVLVQEYQRWVAPLSEEWRDAVADRLSRVLGAMDASRLPAPPGLPRFALRLELQRLDATPGHAVLQQAAWSVLRPDQAQALLSCVSQVSLPAPADVGGVVAAQRAATQQVADQIAQALRQLHAGAPAACPGTG